MVKPKEYAGNPTWKMLHRFAPTYTPDKSRYMLNLLEAVGNLFPCSECGNDFREMLVKYPPEPYLTDNHNLYFYLYFLHDMVNQKIGKKSPPFDEIKAQDFKSLGQECYECKTVVQD